MINGSKAELRPYDDAERPEPDGPYRVWPLSSSGPQSCTGMSSHANSFARSDYFLAIEWVLFMPSQRLRSLETMALNYCGTMISGFLRFDYPES
jgi:hypothetical protein